MQDNPYGAPAAGIEADLPSERLPIETASRWRRFFGLLIDYVVSSIFGFVVTIPYWVYLYQQGGDTALDAALNGTQGMAVDYAIALASTLIYYIALEGWFGWTIGKLATGTRVVNAQGGRPTWGQVVGRTVGRFIPFEPFSLLFASDDDRRGWHDKLSKTYVVRRR
jgi:uncharacterized RDD family membrane protein YckC